MKDFIIDSAQIRLARRMGASAILLIAAILDRARIERFIQEARGLGLDCLVEVHDADELDKVLQTSAEIIGINNRNLHSFEIDMKTTLSLLPLIPDDKLVVAESGYDAGNLALVQGLCDAVLVGTSLMRSPDVADALRRLQQPTRLLKVCGLRDVETARFCERQGVAFTGLNFVPSSRRCLDLDQAHSIRGELRRSLAVGVFQDQRVDEINDIANELDLDLVQLCGNETPQDCAAIDRRIIRTLRINDLPEPERLAAFDPYVQYYIVDGSEPGSGQGYDRVAIHSLKLNRPLLLAGGLDPDNATEALATVPQAIGVDIASGVETDQAIDTRKIELLMERLAQR